MKINIAIANINISISTYWFVSLDEDTSETWEEQQDIDGDYTDKSDFTVRKTAVVGNVLLHGLHPVHFQFNL